MGVDPTPGSYAAYARASLVEENLLKNLHLVRLDSGFEEAGLTKTLFGKNLSPCIGGQTIKIILTQIFHEWSTLSHTLCLQNALLTTGGCFQRHKSVEDKYENTEQ